MRKFLALILALTIVLLLSACGNAPASTSSGQPAVSSGSAKKVSTPSAEPAVASPYTLGETVIVDDDNCTFIVKSVEESSSSVAFSVYCENKTDKVLMFSWDNTTVNGYMNDPFWAKEVAAGKKVNATIDFRKSNLSTFNLLPIEEVQFTLLVYDSNDWMADRLVKERFSIYPTGLTADTVSYPDRLSYDAEQVVVDNEYGSFVIYTTDSNGSYGYTVLAYLENKTENPLMFSWEDVSVNGYMCDPFWAKTVAANSRSYAEISFSNNSLAENGIETVEEIEYCLNMYNADDWMADKYVNDVFVYYP